MPSTYVVYKGRIRRNESLLNLVVSSPNLVISAPNLVVSISNIFSPLLPTTQTMTSLDHIFSHSNAYANYRSHLSEIGRSQPTIPAFAIQLRDLALIEEAHPDLVRGSRVLINFRKRRMLYLAIKEIMRHQQTRHNLLQVYQISDRLQAYLISSFEALQAEKSGGRYDYMSW